MKVNIKSIIHDADTPNRQVDVAVHVNLSTSRDQIAKTLRAVQATADMFELLEEIVAAFDANDAEWLKLTLDDARDFITEIDATTNP